MKWKPKELTTLEEVIQFFEENPSNDEYVCMNFEHFWNGDEADDNSIQIDEYYKSNYKLLLDKAKEAQAKLKQIKKILKGE